MRSSQSEKRTSQSEARRLVAFVRKAMGRSNGYGTNGFVNHRSGFDPLGRLSGGTQANSETGQGRPPADPVQTVSPEERLYVAISRRQDDMTIGQFIDACTGYTSDGIAHLSDEELVGSLESALARLDA